MLITRAWPGPLWAGRDKKNQFPSCQTLPAPDLRDLLSRQLAFFASFSVVLERLVLVVLCVYTREKKARRMAERQKEQREVVGGQRRLSLGLCVIELK